MVYFEHILIFVCAYVYIYIKYYAHIYIYIYNVLLVFKYMHYMYVHIPTLCMIFDSKVDFMKRDVPPLPQLGQGHTLGLNVQPEVPW